MSGVNDELDSFYHFLYLPSALITQRNKTHIYGIHLNKGMVQGSGCIIDPNRQSIDH